jgi:hypothetical protein
VMGAEDSLAAAGAEGRLYLLDYHELLSVVPAAETEPQKYISAPLALFAVPRGGRSLRPVAIQCGQDPDRFPIFTPPPAGTTARDWAWEAAKTVVQVAEGNYHELFVHLARTHLLLEALTVASHRYLAEKHPLNARRAVPSTTSSPGRSPRPSCPRPTIGCAWTSMPPCRPPTLRRVHLLWCDLSHAANRSACCCSNRSLREMSSPSLN